MFEILMYGLSCGLATGIIIVVMSAARANDEARYEAKYQAWQNKRLQRALEVRRRGEEASKWELMHDWKSIHFVGDKR